MTILEVPKCQTSRLGLRSYNQLAQTYIAYANHSVSTVVTNVDYNFAIQAGAQHLYHIELNVLELGI